MQKSSKKISVIMRSAGAIVSVAMLLLCNGLVIAAEIGASWRGPDYLIIGVQKSGTTALYNYIVEHPKIIKAKLKEVNFFNRDIDFKRGIGWYKEQLNYSKELDELVYGEASPEYTRPLRPVISTRIYFLFPHTKLIVLLRDPVERAWSHYKMKWRWGNVGRTGGTQQSFEYELINRPDLLGRGLYADLFKRWFAYFPRNQFLIIKSEDLRANPDKIVNQVFSFLGLEEYHLDSYELYNVGSNVRDGIEHHYPEFKEETRLRLVDYFKPRNKELEELLGMQFNWD
ncbi:MAG: sulfotransferase domain-containing protein [Candidatus Dependentiae bacterium]|nr:sulfotransferase domain-containing protein [Candidatus Dependentiae bacterium]